MGLPLSKQWLYAIKPRPQKTFARLLKTTDLKTGNRGILPRSNTAGRDTLLPEKEFSRSALNQTRRTIILPHPCLHRRHDPSPWLPFWLPYPVL